MGRRSQVLDKLFRYGHVIVVGDAGSGKTSLIDTFVVPELRYMSPNVFSSEIWDSPVLQIREAIEGAAEAPGGGAVDIVSTCRKLLSAGPCFFVVDGCEKLRNIAEEEKEKFERFVDFCIKNEKPSSSPSATRKSSSIGTGRSESEPLCRPPD